MLVAHEQKLVVKKAIQEAKCAEGEIHNLVPFRWWTQWKFFVSWDDHSPLSSPSPGPIDNNILLDPKTKELAKDLVEDEDYFVLPISVWDLLSLWYGAGPPIERKMIKVNHVFQVEVYPLSFTAIRLGHYDNSITRFYSKVTPMKEIFHQISEVWWLPIHNMKIYILPSRLITTYREITYHTFLKTDQLYMYSTMPQISVWVESKRYDGSYRLPPPPTIIPPPSRNNMFHLTRVSGRATISDSSESAVAIGVTGLINLGNTCFMNSVLQCMVALPPIHDYFMQKKIMPNGKVSPSFVKLLRKMWSGEMSYISPHDIYNAIIQGAPYLSGFKQHDAHECLTYLLTNLHNELKDTEESKNTEKNTKKEERSDEKERSIISQIFHGNLKTQLQCNRCEYENNIEECMPWISIPVVGETGFWETCVTVFPARSAPIKINVELESNFTTVKMIQENIIATLDRYEIYLNWENLLFAQTRLGCVQTGYSELLHYVEPLPSPLHHYSLFEIPLFTSAPFPRPRRRKSKPTVEKFDPTTSAELPLRPIVVIRGSHSMRDINPSFSPILQDRHSMQRLKNYLGSFVPIYEFVCQFVCRKMVKRSTSASEGVQLIGFPFLARCERFLSYTRLLELIHEKLALYTTVAEVPQDLIESSTFSRSPTEEKMNCPFSIRYVTQSGSYCGRCHPSTGCRGCPFEDFELKTIENGKVLAIDFQFPDSISFIDIREPMIDDDSDSDYDSDSNSIVEKEECQDKKTLMSCIRSFLSRETLSEKDAWFCSSCDMKRQAMKRISIQKFTDILVIHLKRFTGAGDKIEQIIPFPLEGLDLSLMIEDENSYIYDLVGVVNHNGTAKIGHYTSLTKNIVSGEWYVFNDTKIVAIPEQNVVRNTNSAYILFYARRSKK